jgi:hypothetical protein
MHTVFHIKIYFLLHICTLAVYSNFVNFYCMHCTFSLQNSVLYISKDSCSMLFKTKTVHIATVLSYCNVEIILVKRTDILAG